MDRLRKFLRGPADPTPPEIVPSPVFRDIVRAAFDATLKPIDFDLVTDLKCTKAPTEGIREIVELYALKGFSWMPRWGVSLDYVPRATSSGVAWHRTAKASRIDLGYDPLDYYDPRDRTAFDWTISRFGTESGIRAHANVVAERVAMDAARWFAPIDGLSSLPEAFEREAARSFVRFGFDNYVPYRLALAFTLARLGQVDQSRAEFDRWVSRRSVPDAAASRIRALLENTSVG